MRTATDLLALGPGFGDPLLAAMGLADFTAPVGPDTYVEVLAPTTPDHSVARWLRRVGGASGWVLSTQVPSLDGVRERAAAHGVRVAVETEAMGHRIVQLHPLDVGVLLELDEFLPRESWFWDELPGAKAAHAARTSKADDIVAVDVAVDAASAPALRPPWPGPGPPSSASTRRPGLTADGATLAFGRRTIRFVPAHDGRTGIVAVDLHATDRATVAGSPATCATPRSASSDCPAPPRQRRHPRSGRWLAGSAVEPERPGLDRADPQQPGLGPRILG